MKFLPRNLLLGALLLATCSPAFSAPSNNPYEGELQQLRSSWSSAGDLQKLVLLDHIFHLRDYVDDPALVSQILEQIAASTAKPSTRRNRGSSGTCEREVQNHFAEDALSLLENQCLTSKNACTPEEKQQVAEDGLADGLTGSSFLIRAEADAYLNEIAALQGGPARAGLRHWYEDGERRAQVLAEAQKAPATAENLELLAELEHLAGTPGAASRMQQAAQLSPTAARWAQAAAFTDDPWKKSFALQAGLVLDANDASLYSQLALYYNGRQQLEKAQALLQTALAVHPSNFVLGEQLAGLYLNLGLRSSALQQLKKLEEQSPAPIWLRARLALDYEQIGLLEDAARLARSVLQQKATDRKQLELLARFHQRRQMLAELQSDYVALLRLEPNSIKLWLKLAKLQLNAGNLPKAKESLLRVTAQDSANAEAHRQLAEIFTRLHLPQEAGKELAAASDLLHKDTAPAVADSWLLSDAKELAGETFRHPPGEDDLALADIRVQELYKNGLSRLHIQQIFYVGSEAAAGSHRMARISYSPGAETLRVLHARIWKANGSQVEAEEEGETLVGESASSMYYDMRSRQLRFSGVEKGDVVELEYALLPALAASPYPGYFGELVLMAGRRPIRLKRYALMVPAAQPIFIHAENVSSASTHESDGRRTMVWDSHDEHALPREPQRPGLTEISPYVHVSTMENWEKLGSWYADLIRPQFALDEALRKELERITQGKHSEQEKITAIHEFVLRSTHYVALEFGVYSYKPYPVTQTYARRFGDCKDKASLMIALLQAAGIEAEIALVRTRSLGDVVPVPASIAPFDHAIVYLPKYNLWLDGTAEYAGSELPQEDQGAMALTVSLRGAAQLRQIPVSSAAENYTKRTIHAELTRQGVIHFNGSTVTRGEDAPRLRRDLAVREQQLDLFRRRLAEIFPTVEVDTVAVHGTENLSSDVSVDFEGALNAFQHKSVVTLSSSWMSRSYVSVLAPTSTRAYDLVLTSPWITEEEIHVALPSGASVQQLPRDEEIRTSFGSVRLHYAKSSHEVLIQSRLEFEKSRISVQEYPSFRQFCSTLERSFRKEIVVELAP